jgi:hypothetical protein
MYFASKGGPRHFGWKKDRPDPRDFNATKLLVKAVAVLPPAYIVDPKTIIYNQGPFPACVGFSSAGVKTDEEFRQWNKRHRFDGLWLYKECKKIDAFPGEDGTEPRIALKIMTQGMKESVWWCCCKKQDPKWKIAAYYRIAPDSSLDFVKQIIYQYGSILVGSNWYSNWMTVKSDMMPVPDENVVGGHAYRIVGWNPKGFDVVNSWGTSWGIKGMATMPYDVFKNVLDEGDVWKVVDAV